MNRLSLAATAILAVASCVPSVGVPPEGVGFEDYDSYLARISMRGVEITPPETVRPPSPIVVTPVLIPIGRRLASAAEPAPNADASARGDATADPEANTPSSPTTEAVTTVSIAAGQARATAASAAAVTRDGLLVSEEEPDQAETARQPIDQDVNVILASQASEEPVPFYAASVERAAVLPDELPLPTNTPHTPRPHPVMPVRVADSAQSPEAYADVGVHEPVADLREEGIASTSAQDDLPQETQTARAEEANPSSVRLAGPAVAASASQSLTAETPASVQEDAILLTTDAGNATGAGVFSYDLLQHGGVWVALFLFGLGVFLRRLAALRRRNTQPSRAVWLDDFEKVYQPDGAVPT
ncbi:MAG: hypothetical protein NXI27_30000 [Alphaproteobacteria bacterium]|nr:hypothetical protein [Alphaproteobacteria bacterium]